MIPATSKPTALKLGCPELNAEIFETPLAFFAAVFTFYECTLGHEAKILWGLNAFLNLMLLEIN